jgi:cell division septal protein FtsQ
MPISAPADKRFRRAHVRPSRKRLVPRLSWLAALRAAVIVALVVYAAYRAAHMVLSAGALTITNISVGGMDRLSRGEVVALLEGLRGRNMVTVRLEFWRQKLLTSPWVADASLRRLLPGTIAVVISERQPLGIARIESSLYLIDSRGEVIDDFGPNYAEFDLPVIDGLGAPPGNQGVIDVSRALLVARLLTAVQARPDLAKRVSQIDVHDMHDVAVILKDDTALLHLGDDRFLDRLQSYVDLVPALREKVPHIDYVDLRFDERVYVRPQGRGPGPGKIGRMTRGSSGS